MIYSNKNYKENGKKIEYKLLMSFIVANKSNKYKQRFLKNAYQKQKF